MAHKKTKSILLTLSKLIVVIATIAFVFWINSIDFEGSTVEAFVQSYGYLGLFLASAISGFNVILPVPVAAFYPFFISTGLAPIPTILIISLGMVFGDVLGYMIGRGGRQAFSEKKQKQIQKMTARIERMQERHHFLPAVFLFFYAGFVPLPNELVIIPMGFFKFRPVTVFLAVFCGNIVFNTLFALGFTFIPEIF